MYINSATTIITNILCCLSNTWAKLFACLFALILMTTPVYAFSVEAKQTSPKYSDMLGRLLVAELAAQNNDIELAFSNYMIVAKWSQDPAIAKLATEYAIEMQLTSPAVQAAELWAELAPKSLQAQIVCITLLIGNSSQLAKPYIVSALKIAPQEANHHLLAIQQRLSKNSQDKLIETVSLIASENPKDAQVQLAAGQLHALNLNIEQAESFTDSALKLDKTISEAIKLKAKLIRYQKQADRPALEYLEKKIKELPEDKDIQLFYANALLDNQMVEEAEPWLKALIKEEEFKSEALYTLGEVYTGLKQYDKAKTTLLQIPDDDDNNYFYAGQYLLAYIDEQKGNVSQAITHYSQVGEGKYHIAAYIRAATLMSMQQSSRAAIHLLRSAQPITFFQQKQLLLTEVDILIESADFEEALETVNQAINAIPNDLDFLYARSIIANHTENAQLAEQDLRHILKLNPNHANALNALGYTLAHSPERHEEALDYLKQAINIQPKNPAYMDSMGWLLYKMGNLKDAVSFLEKAHRLSQDGDIAAHYGEVLWVMGQQQKAKEVWKEALEVSPRHDNIQQTMQRLTNSKSTASSH